MDNQNSLIERKYIFNIYNLLEVSQEIYSDGALTVLFDDNEISYVKTLFKEFYSAIDDTHLSLRLIPTTIVGILSNGRLLSCGEVFYILEDKKIQGYLPKNYDISKKIIKIIKETLKKGNCDLEFKKDIYFIQ